MANPRVPCPHCGMWVDPEWGPCAHAEPTTCELANVDADITWLRARLRVALARRGELRAAVAGSATPEEDT